MQMREMTDLQQRMLNDLDWAERAPEVQGNPEHYGKTVVVYDRRILAVGKDLRPCSQRPPRRQASPGKNSSP